MWDDYRDGYINQQRRVLDPGVFVGLAPGPQGGQSIKVVGLAHLEILDIYAREMDIRFLSDFCAYDEFRNVVVVDPDGCFDASGRRGEVKPIYKVPVIPRKPRRGP